MIFLQGARNLKLRHWTSVAVADACVPAFGLEEDILSICCDIILATYDMVREVR